VLSPRSARIGILSSGNGSNFEALAAAAARGMLGGPIVVLLSDNPAAFALQRARRLGIEAVVPPAGTFRTKLADERPWLQALRERAVDVLLLAGFMRRLHAPLLSAFAGRILNIHPSLLPAFPGLEAQTQAFDYGVRVAGCTVHFVDEHLDHGVIVAQRVIPVLETDDAHSLSERILAEEHLAYTEAIARVASGEYEIRGRRFVKLSLPD
jgi:phosphoribosylglycinamide formyltransferase-1